MAENYTKEFAQVCVHFAEAFKTYETTMKIYEFLKEQKEPLSPTDIANKLDFVTTIWGGKKWVNYHRVVNPLKWLYKMGLVDRISYTTTIHIDTYGHYRIDRKVIDGQTYIAKRWIDGGFDKEVTLYKWYAK